MLNGKIKRSVNVEKIGFINLSSQTQKSKQNSNKKHQNIKAKDSEFYFEQNSYKTKNIKSKKTHHPDKIIDVEIDNNKDFSNFETGISSKPNTNSNKVYEDYSQVNEHIILTEEGQYSNSYNPNHILETKITHKHNHEKYKLNQTANLTKKNQHAKWYQFNYKKLTKKDNKDRKNLEQPKYYEEYNKSDAITNKIINKNSNQIFEESENIIQQNARSNLNPSTKQEIKHPLIETSTKVKKKNSHRYTVPRFLKKYLQDSKIHLNQSTSLAPYMFKKIQTDYTDSFFSKVENDVINPQNPIKFTPRDNLQTPQSGKKGAFNNYFHNEFQDKNSTLPVFLIGIITILFIVILYLSSNILSTPWYYTLISAMLFCSLFSVFNLINKERKKILLILGIMLATGSIFYSVVIGYIGVINIVSLLIGMFFIYQSYLDTVKNVLASRLVYVNTLTKTAHSLVQNAVIIILATGFFTSLMAKGASNYISQNILTLPTVQSALSSDTSNNLSKIASSTGIITLKKFQDSFDETYNNDTKEIKKPTVRDLIIWLDYNALATNVLTAEENKNIETANRFETPEKIKEIKTQAINEKLNQYFIKNYASTGLSLGTEVNRDSYLKIYNKHAENKLLQFQNGQDNITKNIPYLNKIESSLLLSVFISILLGLILFVFKIIYRFLTGIVLFFTGQSLRSIIWQILVWTKLVRVEVEPVESEIIKL